MTTITVGECKRYAMAKMNLLVLVSFPINIIKKYVFLLLWFVPLNRPIVVDSWMIMVYKTYKRIVLSNPKSDSSFSSLIFRSESKSLKKICIWVSFFKFNLVHPQKFDYKPVFTLPQQNRVDLSMSNGQFNNS